MTQRSMASPPVIAGFDFIRLLGSGGFSDVFLYEQKFPKRRVAVKVLLTEGLTESTQAAFTAEANLMAQLSAHPYIVTIYHADVSDDARPYFVMEYCSGPSLGDRYKREQFQIADVLQIGIRLSSAVATAHSVGILHRDIKPANVLTNDFGWPALTDFGISSAVESEVVSHTTTSARVTGSEAGVTSGSASVGMSIPWSPPEMFDDEPDPDVRADVFSLAATIYTVLAGHSPFEIKGRSNASVDLVGRIVRGTITPMERTDIPRSLLAVLHKGMSADPDDRFATAVDFARALQRIELELAYSQTPVDVPNLLVKAPERELTDEGADPDETRARTIATVRAQGPSTSTVGSRAEVAAAAPPVVTPSSYIQPPDGRSTFTPPVFSPPTYSPPQAQGAIAGQGASYAPAPSETVIREQLQPSPTGATQTAQVRPSGRRGIWISAALGVVAIVAVIVGIVLFFPNAPSTVADPSAQNGASESQSAIVGGSVPTAVLVSAVADGNAVTFTWSNPSPEDGDSYLWQRTDGAAQEQSVHPTKELSVAIDGIEPGATVCISVDIRRANGSVSANPLAVCHPQ